VSHFSTEIRDGVTVDRMSGRALLIARSLWLAIAVLATLTFVIAVPHRWAQLAHPSAANLANLTSLGLTPAFYAAFSLTWEVLIAGSFALTGFIVFRRCGGERIALLTSIVLVVFGVGNGSFTPAIHSLVGTNPALDLLVRTLEFIAWYGFALFFYLFPNGRFVPGWTRWMAAGQLPLVAMWNYAPDTPFAPLNWPIWLFVPVIGAWWASWIFSQAYRYRSISNAVERQQTRWVVFAVVVVIATVFVTSILGVLVPGFTILSEEQGTPEAMRYMFVTWAFGSVLVLLPVAIAFSILRYRLWDIDFFVNRAIVYGALTLVVVVMYASVVGAFGAALHENAIGWVSLLTIGLVAVVFQPLRDRLQRAVDHLMYGERDDPYAVLSRLHQRSELALAPHAVLPAIADTTAQMLKLPYVAIRLDGETAASSGSPPPHGRTESFPLSYQGMALGRLVVSPRGASETLNTAERRLLTDIALQAGIAAYAVRLTSALQSARERLVTTREEERRRLRRDLHDGLGSKLAGQSLKLEAALDSLDGDPARTRSLLSETVTESQGIITEIRRLVYALRPPALDEMGLLAAIREQAAQCQLNGLQVSVVAPGTLPELPAAIEVAAYRIVQEALTNIVRHANATRGMVTLTIGSDLRLEIGDDGAGLPVDSRMGVGLSSMRERAEEVGGTFTIQSSPLSGALVLASLPLDIAPSVSQA